LERPKVVLDTQGGDRGPAEVISGGLRALEEFDIDLVLAGDEALIHKELSPPLRQRVRHPRLRRAHPEILHAPQVVTMEDAPTEAARRKKESSLVKGIETLRKGLADAFVSPANTGAVMAASLLKLGRIRGIDRPGIAAVLPTVHGRNALVIDVGANVDCDPENLKQFAVMGTIYAQEVLGIPKPKVGLLNIGSERRKGNELALKTFHLLEELENFAGNVEAHQILQGQIDVVVCDGFVGNVLLKSYEGGAAATVEMLKRAVQRDVLARLGSFILIPALRNFKRSLSAARFGGAPLLGVRGVVIVAHGNSDAEAIKNAVRVAAEAVRHRLVEKIEQGIAKYFHRTAKGVAT
jgi:glycerol-3-phosphate acyltransferase PlsX